MYHIPNDERAKRSAEKIYRSLRHILFTKRLEEVTISDIQLECGVSRSTFYRLFDNITDVLSMKLSFFMDAYYDTYPAKTDKILYFYSYWDKHSDLIYLLSKQAEFILKDTLKKKISTHTIYDIYYIEAQASIISALLCKWVERGKKESLLEMSQITKRVLSDANTLLTIF